MGKAKVARTKVPVSSRAVLLRVNRKLAPSNQAVRTWRSGDHATPYYHLDLERNWIVKEHVDLESFARSLGALADFEQLAE